MKKYWFIMICAALAFTACEQSELDAPEVLTGTKVTFKASQEAPSTRTELSGSDVQWSAGDRIKIVAEGADVTSDALTAGGATASFDVTIPDDKQPFNAAYAVYPSDIDASYDGSAFTVTIPSIQSGRDHFGAAAIEVSEVGEENKLAFKHLGAVLKIDIASADVKKIKLSAYGDKPLAGTATVSFSGGVPSIASIASPVTTISLDANGAGSYYATIFPTDFEEGFYVELLDGSDAVIGQRFTGKNISIARADLANLGTVAASTLSGHFVTVEGKGLKDGSSWDNALDWAGFRTGVSSGGSLSGNIFMAGGTYNVTAETSFRSSTEFAIYGGYDPASAGTDLSKRNLSTYETILDAGGSKRILVWNADGIKTVIDGVTFQNATRASNDSGSALILQAGANASFNNCAFKNNTNTGTDAAKAGGGAIRVVIPSSFTNCVFIGNSSTTRGGVLVTNTGSQAVTFSKCVFKDNTAGTADAYKEGGAIVIRGGNVVMDECEFENNTALRGSAIYAHNAAYMLKANKCYFYHNNSLNKSSASTGGAIWSELSSGKMYLNACSFYQNYSGQYGSAIGSKGITCLHNCSFQENENSTGTGAANFFTNSGYSLITNSTFRMYGTSPVAIWAAGGNVSLVNNILVNSKRDANPTEAQNVALKTGHVSWAGSMIQSFGHNVCSKFYQVADISEASTYSTTDGHADVLNYMLYQSPGSHYATWSKWHNTWTNSDGAPEEFVYTNTAYVTSVIDAFDTEHGTDFKAWLNSLTTEGGTALNSDIRGKARGTTTIWPGCYENTSITLQ